MSVEMNEFGIVDLNVVAREAIATGNAQVLQSCLVCSLSDEQLIESVMETKRYELLPLLLGPLKSFFQKAGGERANDLYLDLLLAGEKETCVYIKKECQLDTPELFLRAAKRDVDLFELDEESCARFPLCYYSSITQTDHLPLFLKRKELLLTRLSKQRIYVELSYGFSPKILEYEALHGEHEIVIFTLLRRLIQPNEDLLRSICSQVECKELLTKEFSLSENKKVLRLLLELGARPSDKQKEALRAKNSKLHAKLFAEDV